MKKYLKKNLHYWDFDYSSKNVESVIFRLLGVLKKFYIKKNRPTFLDFGCGQGATINFLNKLGYSSVGVDISKKNIELGKKYFKIKNLYTVPLDSFNLNFLKYNRNKKFDVIIAQQSIYYFDEDDFKLLLDNFYNSLEKKGILYCSIMSTKHSLFKNAKKYDGWLYKHRYKYKKKDNKFTYTFFIKNPKSFSKKYFNRFKLLSHGEYFIKITNKTTNNHHFTFILQKV